MATDVIVASQLSRHPNIPLGVAALEAELQTLQKQRRYLTLQRQISAERKAVNDLEKDGETVPIITEPRAVENGFEFTASSTAPVSGELERLLQSPLVRDAEKHAKALQIMDFLWVDSIPQYSSHSFGTDSGIELRVAKIKPLIESPLRNGGGVPREWGLNRLYSTVERLKGKGWANTTRKNLHNTLEDL
ncbi:hypothetical protein LOTGIDRAFT_164521 [Lottia gigantea]|uniref:Uncharacterized protein n=1 Tax=Lottia gigantea TaxID=225164 RepID=V4AA65_LOTGI|nr:hypothetical protein LOTGIDRAFT_164521 [Lottia gigantea]ESO90206.1 hypothetical protein LOTGIDRAFT_164521 [Lottia gigantea]